jgi:cell division protein FtsB
MKVIYFCVKHKYILTVFIFILYLLLGDSNVIENRRLNKEIKMLESELQQYNTIVNSMKKQNNLSSTINSKEDEEEYFRKHHHLKKEDEDIFRIIYIDETKE